MSIPKTAVSRPTTMLIVFCVIVALCGYSALRLPLDLFPDIEIPYLLVSTTYDNAGPYEVEENVTRLIESMVTSISGVKEVSSTSSDGSSLVMIELNYGTNLDTASNEARDRVDMVKRFLPDGIDSPLIIQLDPSMMPIIFFNVTGNRSPEELRTYTEDTIVPRLERVDGVASVFVSGGQERAIRVEVPIDRLEAYGLTISQISQAIASQNIQASGGTITEGDYDFIISAAGDFNSIEDIRNTVISYRPITTGLSAGESSQLRTILLRDVANVYDGFKDRDSSAFLDNVPGVRIGIQKQSGKNSVQTAQAVREQVKDIEKILPADMRMTETRNNTDIIENSIGQVGGSAMQGAILAIIVLFVFLRSWKSTIIVGLTIPVSLIITLGIVYFAGYSLNIMTLAGLTLGVGMLVDNSIVILENIYSYRERGSKPKVAAILGSQEMIMAIVSSTLTTICVFLPLIMYKNDLGVIGQVFEGFTFTVIFSLTSSLLVAIILVPVLASKYIKIENVKKRKLKGFAAALDAKLGSFFDKLDNSYARSVKAVLHHRKLTLLVIIGLFAASCALIPVLGFIYTPTQEQDIVVIDIKTPLGTRLEVTEEIAHQVAAIAEQEVEGYEFISIAVGGGGMFSTDGTNTASVDIKLLPYDQRIDRENDVKNKMRAYFDSFPGTTFSFGSAGGGGFGSGSGGIDVIVRSDNLDQAILTADEILDLFKTKAASYITEPDMDIDVGLPQIDINLDRAKLYTLGLNVYSVTNEISGNIGGTTATVYRNDGDEVDVIVSLPEEDRSKVADLNRIFVLNSSGTAVPLSSFASYEETTAPVSISRENQQRVIHVTGTPVEGSSLGDVQEVIEQLIEENIPPHDDVMIEYGGDIQDLQENVIQFVIIAVMAIVLVFAVMASLFESFLEPLIVLFTIPLSLIGIVAIYFITGTQLNVITAVGVLVLFGVIVNNGIVLVDYTNLLRKRGASLEEACIQAGRNRLRPILMTTLTTVLALIPMAFFPGEGSEMVQPIGLTVFGGLTVGTCMTLFLMPVLYYIFNSRRDKRLAKRRKKILAQGLTVEN